MCLFFPSLELLLILSPVCTFKIDLLCKEEKRHCTSKSTRGVTSSRSQALKTGWLRTNQDILKSCSHHRGWNNMIIKDFFEWISSVFVQVRYLRRMQCGTTRCSSSLCLTSVWAMTSCRVRRSHTRLNSSSPTTRSRRCRKVRKLQTICGSLLLLDWLLLQCACVCHSDC